MAWEVECLHCCWWEMQRKGCNSSFHVHDYVFLSWTRALPLYLHSIWSMYACFTCRGSHLEIMAWGRDVKHRWRDGAWRHWWWLVIGYWGVGPWGVSMPHGVVCTWGTLEWLYYYTYMYILLTITNYIYIWRHTYICICVFKLLIGWVQIWLSHWICSTDSHFSVLVLRPTDYPFSSLTDSD